jgi:hypothetical protein
MSIAAQQVVPPLTAMKQALEALELCNGAETVDGVVIYTDQEIAAIKEAIAELESQEPVAHSVIAGALFDFMGWLTSRKERIVLSSADNASPAVEAITEFSKMRNLSLNDAKVQDWHTHPPQRTWVGLTDEEIEEGIKQSWVTEQAFQSAAWWAEDKLKQKNGFTEENT